MWQYRDYLTVSKDFIPVFSAAVDSKHKSTWKFFIPHKAMHDILQKLTKALERNNVGDSRSLWMTGAYGTGKTFASFVIKHLLEDDLDEIEDYFQKHKMITPLWLRFKALRERNRYLVVYRSSSAHINSNRKLLMEIQEAIKEQLKNKGYKNAYTKGILDTIMEKITEGLFNWEGIYSKYRDRFLTIGSSEEVIDRLRSGDIKTSEKVAQVLEEEGVNLADTPHEVVAWIKEVIVENELQGIVFIWDEFTEFFANNVPVTSLQELAHATAEMPFYLFLVTHRALNQFSRIDDDTRQKLLDRFHNSQLEMSPVTAYLLIANVIEPIPEVKADWETRRESLWGPVDRIMMYINLLGGDNVHREEVKQLAPIHPFSAYLLATISSLYSSSQRTLFQFLKTEEHGSFQWFLGNYPKENCYWLTPDFLWEYFFENTKIESAHEINDILSHYFSVKDSLDNDDELAVFRVMLLLTALWRQTGGSNKLLKPSLSILQRMFLGTDLAQKTPQAAESLCTRGAMLALNAGNDCEYIIPTMTIDQEKLKQARNWAEKTLAFEKVISMDKAVGEFASDLRRLLLLRGAGEKRHKEIQIISGKDLKQRGERVISSLEKTYEIGLIMVTAQEDEQLNDTEQKAIEISKLYSNHVIIISQSPFGKKRWQEWLDCRARQRYAEEMRDGNSQRYYESKAKALGNEWLAELKAGRLRSIFRGKQSELAGMEVISDYLSEICSKVFPYGPETLNKIATLYTNSFGKAGAEIGLNVANNILRPYKDVTDELDSQGLWADSKVLNTRPDHPLSRMKVVINDTMDESSNTSIKSLWEKLEQPPFGLMPSPIGILLFAYLLRDYANGYYYSDGANSYPLNPNKLAELIDAVVKNARMSENYSLRKMSAEGEMFCQMVREIFNLPEEKASYPEEARKNMRVHISNLGYPLWVLNYSPKINNQKTKIANAIDKLEEILGFNNDNLDNRQLQEVVEQIKPVSRELSNLISKDNLHEGIKTYWVSLDSRLGELLQDLNLTVPQVMSMLKTLLNEEIWLWKQERVRDRLPLITCELEILHSLNKLCNTNKHDLGEIKHYFKTVWYKSKLPLFIFKEGQQPQISELIKFLHKLIFQSSLITNDMAVLASQMRNHQGEVQTLLSNGPKLVAQLAQKYCNTRLSFSEGEALYQNLPNLSEAADLTDVTRSIANILASQSKKKKIREVNDLWRELTDTFSPADWSEKNQTPIQWVLEGNLNHVFLKSMEDLNKLTSQDIEITIEHLKTHQSEITTLNDKTSVQDKFIQVAAGDYADLVTETHAINELQQYIYKSINGKVYHWPSRQGEINRLVRLWVMANYKDTAYPQVIKVIDDFSPEDIKQFIKELAEDAVVGARLLATYKARE